MSGWTRLRGVLERFRSQPSVNPEPDQEVVKLRRSNQRLRREVRRLKKQVQSMTALDEIRESLNYVFIVTYGRSGSTLLQGILNSAPGVMVRGENRAALYHLFRHYQTCLDEAEKKRRVGNVLDARHPWFGIDEYPAGVARRLMQSLVLETILRPLPDTRLVGFKEIRWQQKELADYVAFLRELFPGAKFVFNTRNHEHVSQSKWWAEYPNALKEVARVEGLQAQVAEQLGDAAYRVHFDDYVAEPSILRGLFEWLDVEFDEAKVRAVMAERHSY